MRQITDHRNRIIGYVSEDGLTYHTERNAKKHQIYEHPKYGSAIAIDFDVLKRLIKARVVLIEVTILHFEKKSFRIITSMKKLLIEGEKTSYHSNAAKRTIPQRRLAMNSWTRVYAEGEQRKFKVDKGQVVLQ